MGTLDQSERSMLIKKMTVTSENVHREDNLEEQGHR